MRPLPAYVLGSQIVYHRCLGLIEEEGCLVIGTVTKTEIDCFILTTNNGDYRVFIPLSIVSMTEETARRWLADAIEDVPDDAQALFYAIGRAGGLLVTLPGD